MNSLLYFEKQEDLDYFNKYNSLNSNQEVKLLPKIDNLDEFVRSHFHKQIGHVILMSRNKEVGKFLNGTWRTKGSFQYFGWTINVINKPKGLGDHYNGTQIDINFKTLNSC